MNRRVALIVCGVLRHEIERLLASEDLDAAPIFLDSGLCTNLPALADSVQRAVASARGSHDGVVLVYGECHPAIDRIAQKYGTPRVRASNCMSMLLGEARYTEEAKRGRFFLLPEWAGRWRQVFRDRLGLDDDVTREILGTELTGAIYLDTGTDSCPEEVLADFSAGTGMPVVETWDVDLAHLGGLIKEAIYGLGRDGRNG